MLAKLSGVHVLFSDAQTTNLDVLSPYVITKISICDIESFTAPNHTPQNKDTDLSL